MPELNKHEIRSPELQEVMSEIPGSFLKWGLFLFFAIVMAIVGVSWFINYPDLVTAPVTITTFNSPASLVARAGGKIERLFVGNNDEVKENQAIAVIDNQAEWNDMKTIASFIESFDEIFMCVDWGLNSKPISSSVYEFKHVKSNRCL